MSANPALPILITLLIALFPIALYCMVLASINRRPSPLLVRGTWDFAGVLFAVSGIVLWAVPAMLSSLYQRAVTETSVRSFDALWWQWSLIWAAYYGLILSGGGLLFWLRRHTTAIYNVHGDQVALLVSAALQRLGIEFTQNTHQQFLIAEARQRPPAEVMMAVTDQPLSTTSSVPDAVSAPFSAAVEVDVFAPLCHATLHWYDAKPRLRGAIEEELRKNLDSAPAVDNPASLWQLGISIVLFGAIFLSVLFYILVGILPRRW